MTSAEKPSTPSEAEIMAALDGQLTDPILNRVHGFAAEYEYTINNYHSPVETIAEYVKALDSVWPYMRQPVRFTGMIWERYPDQENLVSRYVVDQAAISNGFDFAAIGVDEYDLFHAGHALIIDKGRNDGTVSTVFAPIATIEDLSLPFPSSEMREQNFRYDAPGIVADIDEMKKTAPRPDQVLLDLGDIEVKANPTNSYDIEHMRDLEEYLNRNIVVDHELPYRVTIQGRTILVSGGGEEAPWIMKKGQTAHVTIERILVRPLNEKEASESGLATYVPFLQTIMHSRSLNFKSQKLLIPASSLRMVEAIRYDDLGKPKFEPKQAKHG